MNESRTGWICPRCDTVNAPTRETCANCKPEGDSAGGMVIDGVPITPAPQVVIHLIPFQPSHVIPMQPPFISPNPWPPLWPHYGNDFTVTCSAYSGN